MTWAVLDTNTLVSGMGWDGAPARVVDLAVEGRFTLITSRALLDELAAVIQRPKIARHFSDPLSVVLLIETMSVKVEPNSRLDVIAEDPDDNRVLEAAQAGRADYIVSGDRHLLDLGSFEEIQIVRAGRFLELLGRASPDASPSR